MGDKAKANLKPDSEKSTLEKGQEQVKGAADSVAGTLQPCMLSSVSLATKNFRKATHHSVVIANCCTSG